MYLYIYDSFLNEPKFTPFLSSLERRITDLDIRGKIARLSVLKNAQELIADAVKAGYSTIVAIGDDHTFAKVINIVAPLDATLGLIPVDSSSSIARVLGIPPRELACDIISARMVKRMDLAKINNYYFLSSAQISNAKVSIVCGTYTVQPTTEHNVVRICNVGIKPQNQWSDPTDGILEAIIMPTQAGWFARKNERPTVVAFKKIRINSDIEGGATILTDEDVKLKTPADVEVAPQRLKVIVGSTRLFD